MGARNDAAEGAIKQHMLLTNMRQREGDLSVVLRRAWSVQSFRFSIHPASSEEEGEAGTTPKGCLFFVG